MWKTSSCYVVCKHLCGILENQHKKLCGDVLSVRWWNCVAQYVGVYIYLYIYIYIYWQLQTRTGQVRYIVTTCKPGVGKTLFSSVKSQCRPVLVCITTNSVSGKRRTGLENSSCCRSVIYVLPARNAVRVLGAMKWTSDEENGPLVDVRCVPVDFTAGFISMGIWICLLFYARLRTWQRTTSLRFCMAADMCICGGRLENDVFLCLRSNVWICTLHWGHVICMLPYAFVSCVSSSALVKACIYQSECWNGPTQR